MHRWASLRRHRIPTPWNSLLGLGELGIAVSVPLLRSGGDVKAHLRALVHRMALFRHHGRHTRNSAGLRLGRIRGLCLIDRCILSADELITLLWWRLLHPSRLLGAPILCVLIARVEAIRIVTTVPDNLSPFAHI